MFKLVKKISSTFLGGAASEDISIDSLTELQLALLSEFLQPQNIKKLSDGWENVLKRPVEQTCNEFIKLGLLVSPPKELLLDSCYTAVELKTLLRQNELPVSGTKQKLIERLLPIAVSLDSISKDIYFCTPDAKNRVDNYLAKKNKEESEVAEKVLRLLSERNIKQAIILTAQLKKSYTDKQRLKLFNNPIAIKEPENYREKLLTLLLSANPQILSDFGAQDLESLRLSAAMWQIGFSGKYLELPLNGYIGNARFSIETSRRMVVFYAINKMKIDQFKNLDAKITCSIIGGLCQIGQSMNGKKFSLNEIPELPYKDCQDTFRGCTCSVKPGINFEEIE